MIFQKSLLQSLYTPVVCMPGMQCTNICKKKKDYMSFFRVDYMGQAGWIASQIINMGITFDKYKTN